MPPLCFPQPSALSNNDDARLSRIEATLPQTVRGGRLFSDSSLAVPGSSAVLANGQISPQSGISATGNVFPFVAQGSFGFAWDGAQLTIYWDGTNGSTPFVIRRADGSQLSIPRGSLAMGAVQPNTKYAFAPFVAVAQPQRVSFVVGDVGSPRYAFSPAASATTLAMASQTQRLAQNERLTDGFIYFTTGAANSNTSGGGTGGDSTPYTGASYEQDAYRNTN